MNLFLASQLKPLGFKQKCLLLLHEFDFAQQLELIRIGDRLRVNLWIGQSTGETDLVIGIYREQVIVELEFLLERALLLVNVVEDDSALEELPVSLVVHQALVRAGMHLLVDLVYHWVLRLSGYTLVVTACLSKH